jgi:hypothetical protein
MASLSRHGGRAIASRCPFFWANKKRTKKLAEGYQEPYPTALSPFERSIAEGAKIFAKDRRGKREDSLHFILDLEKSKILYIQFDFTL